MIPGDTHVHSCFSSDSQATMEENVLSAIDKGMPWICMTDHIDYDFPEPEMVFEFEMAPYFETLSELKEKYKDRIEVLAGVEIGMLKEAKKKNEYLIRSYPFDFCIGSQHLVFNRDPYYPDVFEAHTDREVYREYFEETLDNIRAFHSFDSLGHLDYVLRYGKEVKHYRYSEFAEVLDEILKLLLRYNIALEVNTAGLRKGLRTTNPQVEVLKRYRELGGTLITIGSDAHQSYYIGYGFDYTAGLLKSLGFTHTARYVSHHPKFTPL